MRIPLYFEKLSMYERWEEPCTVAIPFAKGALKHHSDISILDGTVPVPSQTSVTAVWPDGSIKWVLTHFLANLPANQGKRFEFCTETASVLPEKSVNVRKLGDACFIDTDVVTVELNGPGQKGLFRSIRAANGFSLDDIIGPTIQDGITTTYNCEIGPAGWNVLENGPIRTVVQTKGKHSDPDNQSWLDYTARIYAYAGKPWVRVDYQIIHRESDSELTVDSLGMHIGGLINEAGSDIQTGLGKSNYATTIRHGKSGERLSHKITAEELKFQGNEQFPEVLYGTFWGDWCDPQTGGFSVTLHQAQQNFPKLLEVSDDGIEVGIIPEGTRLTLLQGMAKTHRMYIHVHGAEETLESINSRSLQFQLPDRPVLDTEIYEQAEVLEPLIVTDKHYEVERTMVNLADSRVRAYGMLHWGDAPDSNYTDQGRGKGDLVWTNNEYDLPHSMMHLYARKGERRFLDYLLVAAEHWMDVDICHYSKNPLRFQGQIPHSAKHVTDNPAVCHEWVEGLLDYYHMTGEQSALDSAIGVGENVLRILLTPRFQGGDGMHARESGWALRSLGALYNETGDEKWLHPADRIVDQFETWKDKYGAWISPYTDHTLVRVPFMIAIAVNSLMRYYQIRPQERIKNMIVAAVEDVLEHTYLKDEKVFMYKELPSLIRISITNPNILEALSYAYEFTGNRVYLEAGKASFKSILQWIDREIGEGKKEIVGDAMVWWQGLGPKAFAQNYYPLFCYYRTAVGAGIDL